MTLSDDLLKGAKAAAQFMGRSPREVYHLAERGYLPVHKKGGSLYFRKSELDRAFRSAEAAQ